MTTMTERSAPVRLRRHLKWWEKLCCCHRRYFPFKDEKFRRKTLVSHYPFLANKQLYQHWYGSDVELDDPNAFDRGTNPSLFAQVHFLLDTKPFKRYGVV
jgi:hypothetical protein